jgi:hypothetical protein
MNRERFKKTVLRSSFTVSWSEVVPKEYAEEKWHAFLTPERDI